MTPLLQGHLKLTATFSCVHLLVRSPRLHDHLSITNVSHNLNSLVKSKCLNLLLFLLDLFAAELTIETNGQEKTFLSALCTGTFFSTTQFMIVKQDEMRTCVLGMFFFSLPIVSSTAKRKRFRDRQFGNPPQF